MRERSEAKRFITLCLCWSLLLPLVPREASAIDASKVVTVEIGQPAVWSLGQAHYLLTSMHKRNRALSTKLPNEDALDPNRINSSRLEVLRSALRVEAQLDESLDVKNDLERQRFRNEQARQEQARKDLEDRRGDLAELERDLLRMNLDLARLREEDRQSTEARNRATPPKQPTDLDNLRKHQITDLALRVEQKEREKARLESEIASLTTAANTAPTAPDLETPSFSSATPGGLPTSTALDTFLTSAINDFERPSLAASIALDNFVQMQYEIIAKQLTLLRDEVGPDERVIFLELPAAIYTVDKLADGYIAQVEWKVTHYYDQDPAWDIQEEVIKAKLGEEGRSDTEVKEFMRFVKASETGDPQDQNSFPITLEMIQKMEAKGGGYAKPVEERMQAVRALDIIPRQSALNVNQHHAMVKFHGLLGALKWLSGLGIKLDFQRQREVYEQFVQQEIFASGSGKGSHKFGWTFGPLPGTQRIAPGQRTTYAVLAVPRNTLALELSATSKVFRRNRPPKSACRKEADCTKTFLVRVPGAKTERFWVDRLYYTPVTKGKRVTAFLTGSYFSPQLGVMVNGVPLTKVISIARSGADDPPPVTGTGIQGEYELTNSRQIVLSFSMGDGYVGTPLITLVTPEKSTAINYFTMLINRQEPRVSLENLSVREPMFMEEFSLTQKLEPLGSKDVQRCAPDGTCHPVKYAVARLQGKGLRPSADIWVNDRKLELLKDSHSFDKLQEIFGTPTERSLQESTGSYLLYFLDPGDKWRVRYRQPTRQGYDEVNFEQVVAAAPFAHEIRHYRQGAGRGPAEVHLNLASRDHDIVSISLTEPAQGGRCGFQDSAADKKRRAKCEVPRDGSAERDFITVQVGLASGKSEFLDLVLPVRPLAATVTNPRTGNASGHAAQQEIVTIKGEGLQNVKSVFFGDLEATILSASDRSSILVKTPKVDGIARGQSIVVPVLFRTKTDGDTKLPAGAFYTYLGEPLEPHVVVWPYAAPAQHPAPVQPKP